MSAPTGVASNAAGTVWLPSAESPMPMPGQSLRQGRLSATRPATSPRGMGWRRLLVIGSTAVLTAVAAMGMLQVLRVGGLSVLDGVLLVLFVALFAWIALSSVSAGCGFVLLLAGRANVLGIDPDSPLPVPGVRTALLMPTYHEDPARIMAGLQAVYESVAATGQLHAFDFFVLSDSRREEVAKAELEEFAALLERTGAHGHLFYRRRTDNTGRKAGNIAEWVQRFGGAYPQMLILDADSVMSGSTLVRLASALEHHPGVGVLQTLPRVVNGQTLFARMQQFGGHVYGPVIARGVTWWHGSEGNYWGHNAMLRTRAFAEHAGLPELPGRQPFGGHVLSHDFVEAALMRRGGWAIHLVPQLDGSYEEGPPSLTDLLVRDRRWCQGNLQHGKVVGSAGLHWISRMHMMVGIGHYFTAPMWAMLMLVGLAIPLYNSDLVWDGFQLPGFSPLRYWAARDAERVAWLFAATMGVLFAPKVFGFVAMLTDADARRGAGGAGRAFIGVLIESLLAALMAPIVMYRQSRGVAEVLAGRDSGWEAQRRDDGSVPLSSLVRSYAGLSLFGLFMGALAWAVSPGLALWMAPVVVGMILAIPTVWITSARTPGRWLRRHRILCIPEELEPPPVLRRATELRAMATPPQA
ncbi:glucans biosynthesis glucosyltransferase MdoH [Pseudoxanthomonas daejeonensis]|uniref:Glucans biosynthesis glucosyltransferase H n=1 Tax=Pseudoxanthomonas daejeonensis TaxID=266062 RepID=A0ABQ6ZB60_9GAMM|nr:glucans biosynthesis glucosyltransferase MdoH [Pseudoxanthomonas daejeonensis]KAF1697340.1 glucans biosynthesis glucosyltransferase MdoH [Pseudoxanthomonas daejeonensis]